MFQNLFFRAIARVGTLAGCLVVWGLICPNQAVLAAESPVVSLQIDLNAFAKSKIGDLLLQAGTQFAAAEMDKDPDEVMGAVIDALGFDPLKQDARLAVDVQSIQDPMSDLIAVLTLKDSTGNLEGLLLAAPGYKSSSHNDRLIHSMNLDGQPFFVAFNALESGEKQVVASASLEGLMETLQSQPRKQVVFSDGQFANFQLLSPPKEMIDETPFAALVDLLQETGLSVSEDSGDLVVQINLAAHDEEKANQLQQLAQGVIAMVSLFKEEISQELNDEETAKQMLSVIKRIRVQRKGSVVTLETRVPEETIINFLRKEAALPL